VIFTDISGFVALSMKLGPERVVELLNDIVRRFDERAQAYGVEKIKTIGDAYMAVAGVPQPHPRPACAAAALATDMLAIVADARARNDIDLAIRVGIATGPVTAGVIGTHKFSYDVWGDTVNLAARLESASRPGRILVCEKTCDALRRDHEASGECRFEPAGRLEIKGQGQKPAWFIQLADDVPGRIVTAISAERRG
jgi:adenylate cyclase